MTLGNQGSLLPFVKRGYPHVISTTEALAPSFVKGIRLCYSVNLAE